MIDTKQKYVRLNDYDEIIIFNILINHSFFKNLNIKSAGFCYVKNQEVNCFGESHLLGIKSNEDDSYIATKQLFGYDCAEKVKLTKTNKND